MDLMQREGKYNVPPQAGKTLGVEFSGWIEELGEGDHGDFRVGDEVFGLAYGGWFYLNMRAKPEELHHLMRHYIERRGTEDRKLGKS